MLSVYSPETIESVVNELLSVIKMALDSSRATLRKAAIECLVEMYFVMGNKIWDRMEYFEETQRKLLGVFILRSEKNRTALTA